MHAYSSRITSWMSRKNIMPNDIKGEMLVGKLNNSFSGSYAKILDKQKLWPLFYT